MPLALSRTGVVFKKCYIDNAGDFDRPAGHLTCQHLILAFCYRR